MVVKQAVRPVAVSSPLGEDVLLFRAMTASESLCRLSQFDLDLLSEDHNIKLEDVLGQSVTVRLTLPQDGGTRFFNGFASHFSYVGWTGDLARYRAQLRPWPWFLTRTADSRIFQKMKVPDIIEQIFRDQGFSDFENRLSGEYREWEYCVQYRETDFNFVSRLMEQEGIYYYFLHEDGKHTMVLADAPSAHEPVSGYEQVPYFPPEEGGRRKRDHISEWSVGQEVKPGAYTLRDFDFEKPSTDLEVRLNKPFEHAQAEGEVYDYPGEYVTSSEGDNYVKVRLEELHSQHERAEGEGDVAGLAAGALFKLTDYPREDQNREYLVVSSTVELRSDAYVSEAAAKGETLCLCRFTAMDGQRQFRPPRVTPKPVVQGPQTAIVVGKSGEEIWTDKYGRVKVQFHWDREGAFDEKSSCWIRVSHPWAGKNWGAIAIPRIGQEVIVDFLEGDPDRPIITGRVYNGDYMPPYGLPDNATQSGVKSRSSKGGADANFNEIRFEDKMGEEQLYIHAEKNQDIEVENDETHSVGHDRTKTIDNDETSHIKNNRTETVDSNEKITIGGDRTESVSGNESLTVLGNRTDSVTGNETRTITGSMTETISGSLSQTVAGGITITTPAAITVTAQGGFTVVAPGGTRNVDSFFDSLGGVDSNTFGMTKSACMVSINLVGGVALESKNVVVEGVTAKLEDVYMAYALKALDTSTVAIKIENDSLDLKWGDLHIIS